MPNPRISIWCWITSNPLPNREAGNRFLNRNHVVSDQPVAPKDKVQGTFALSDPALPEDQDSHAKDIHEHPMNARGGSKLFFQQLGHLFDKIDRTKRGSKERNPLLLGFLKKEFWNLEISGDDDTGHIDTADLLDHFLLLIG